MAISDLPDNILHNILARLPSKPLLRSRCVSKQWNRLISDPFFMKSRSRRMTILSTSSLDLHIIDHDKAHTIINLRSLFGCDQVGSKHVTAVGSFNGIVVLALFHLSRPSGMILYNPLTRASKKVPDPIPDPLDVDDHVKPIISYAFGVTSTPDDSKIVKIEVRGEPGGHRVSTCQVLDLEKSASGWSMPQEYLNLTYNFINGTVGVFLDGFLYWIASRNIVDKVILALNVKEMVFSTIDLPQHRNMALNNLLGCSTTGLCLVNGNGDTFDVWAMNEGSWSKTCSFNFNTSTCDYLCYCNPISCLYILDQGRFLMMDSHGQRFFRYDTSKHIY